jgi:predicted phage terminase large subunit-like protein
LIDSAYTSKKTNDPSALMIAGIEDNQVYVKHCSQFLVRAGWNENFIYELTTFPNAKHDDQLDCLVHAMDTLLGVSGKIIWYMRGLL